MEGDGSEVKSVSDGSGRLAEELRSGQNGFVWESTGLGTEIGCGPELGREDGRTTVELFAGADEESLGKSRPWLGDTASYPERLPSDNLKSVCGSELHRQIDGE